MNHSILTSEVQQFLKENAAQSPAKVALKKSPFEQVSASELAQQIDSRQRLKSKLPHWMTAESIYFPARQNAEQCSSEQTALYKSSLVQGKTAIDLTGGFGVDVWAFSQRFDKVHYCEMNEQLFPIVEHNFKQLQCANVNCHLGDGLETLKNSEKEKYDLVYLDPARRDEHNRKMVRFSDCVPDIIAHKSALFEHTNTIMVKASPMMDISLAIEELQNVKAVHVVALKNECKELLFHLEKDVVGEATIFCLNLNETENFTFNRSQEQLAVPNLSLPKTYLYEPNSAILKAGAFNVLSERLGLSKLHASTHLYTSAQLITNFPGKIYHIAHSLDYNKKSITPFLLDKKANIKTYNFVNTPAQMQKKLGLNDGGDAFLFGVKTMDEKYRVLIAQRLTPIMN